MRQGLIDRYREYLPVTEQTPVIRPLYLARESAR